MTYLARIAQGVQNLNNLFSDVEKIMASIADLNTKLDAMKADVDAFIAEHNAPPVATQADLDALGERMDAIHAEAQAAMAPPAAPAA